MHSILSALNLRDFVTNALSDLNMDHMINLIKNEATLKGKTLKRQRNHCDFVVIGCT